MARFIPYDKIKQLREAAKSGDKRAKKILMAQLDGKDFDVDLEDYFKPAPEPVSKPVSVPTQASGIEQGPAQEPAAKEMSGLERFLADNGVSKGSPDYDSFVEDYYMEFPNERPAENAAPALVSETSSVSMAIPEETPASDVQEEIDLTKGIAQELLQLVSICDQTLITILNNDDIEDTTKKGAMTTLQEVKQSVLDNFEKIKKIKKSLDKKQEEVKSPLEVL